MKIDWASHASVTILAKFGKLKMKFFKCRDNRNFHLLLVGLAVIDTLLIVDLIIEVSIVGVFMQKEPKWYILVLEPSCCKKQQKSAKFQPRNWFGK